MQCEYRLWRHGRLRECGRRVGVRTWYDARGDVHAACASHVAERLHRYAAADPPMPRWLHEDPASAAESVWDVVMARLLRLAINEPLPPCMTAANIPEGADPITAAKGAADRESWSLA